MGLNICHRLICTQCLFLPKRHLHTFYYRLLVNDLADDVLGRPEKEVKGCRPLPHCSPPSSVPWHLPCSEMPIAHLWEHFKFHATKETRINYRLRKGGLECCGGTFHLSRRDLSTCSWSAHPHACPYCWLLPLAKGRFSFFFFLYCLAFNLYPSKIFTSQWVNVTMAHCMERKIFNGEILKYVFRLLES